MSQSLMAVSSTQDSAPGVELVEAGRQAGVGRQGPGCQLVPPRCRGGGMEFSWKLRVDVEHFRVDLELRVAFRQCSAI